MSWRFFSWRVLPRPPFAWTAFAMLLALSAILSPSARAQDREETVKVNGFARTVQVHLPAGYTAKKRYPVVLALHGAGADANVMARLSHFDQAADHYGFIVVYPNAKDGRWTNVENENVRTLGGFGRRRGGLAGNGGVRPTDIGGMPADENLFFDNLLDQIESEYSVDTLRIYATGFSDGGFMGFRLGCQLAARIAAVATVSANLPAPLAESCGNWAWRAVPLLMINGTSDPVVPYQGRLSYSSGYFLLSVKDSVKAWAKMDGCGAKPRRSTLPPRASGGSATLVETFTDCKEGAAVVLYSVTKGGHTWPGGEQYMPESVVGKTSGDFDATDVIWKFFAEHPMPATHPQAQ